MVARKSRETKASRRVGRELREDHRELGDGIVYADGTGSSYIEPVAVQRLSTEQRSAYRALADLALERQAIEREIRHLIVGMRSGGTSWAVIGVALGTSGQAARKRYGIDA